MDDSPPAESTVAIWASWLFWSSLACATILGGALGLADRYVESERLRERYARNLHQITALEQEIAHHDRLAGALRDDPQFVAQLAESEFGDRSAETFQIPAQAGLSFDPRVLPIPARSPRLPVPSPLLPWLEQLASDPSLRGRCSLAVALLLLLSFGCCHEAFTSGGAMGTLRLLANRYRRS